MEFYCTLQNSWQFKFALIINVGDLCRFLSGLTGESQGKRQADILIVGTCPTAAGNSAS